MTRRGDPRNKHEPPFVIDKVIRRTQAQKLLLEIVEAHEDAGKTKEEIAGMLGLKRAMLYLWMKDKRYNENCIWALKKFGYTVEDLGLKITTKEGNE